MDKQKNTFPRLLHDYGAGSCLSCGGAVGSWLDALASPHSVTRCLACGLVEPAVFVSDTGQPVQGFMTHGDLAALPGQVDDDGTEIPF